MNCPKCGKINLTELDRSKNDNIDNLDHSHIKCNDCGNQFNHWNENVEKLKQIFASSYNLYK